VVLTQLVRSSQASTEQSLLTDGDFTEIFVLADTPPAVQRRFKGQKYMLRFVSAGSLLSTMCFDFEGNLSEDVPTPPGANGFANEEEQPEGPGGYYVTLPSRAYLRHSDAQHASDHEDYRTSVSFGGCDGGPATAPECDRYTLAEYSNFSVEFKWFPEGLLRRVLKNLNRGAKKP